MRRRFKARELWLFAPFLLIIAAALYWGRVEQVSKPGASEMFVLDFKVEAAPDYWQERGWSHRVTVTLSHPWPRPRWWGYSYIVSNIIDPLHPEAKQSLSRGQKLSESFARGEALTVVRDGKMWRLPREYGGNAMSFQVVGNDYVSNGYFKLSSIPKEWGAVTFHGLYRIADQPQIAVERKIRVAGETLPPPQNRDAGARVVRVTVSSFAPSTGSNRGNGFVTENRGIVQVVFQRNAGLTGNVSRALTRIYDVEVVDAKGKIYQSNQKGKFRFQGVDSSAAGSKLRQELPQDEDVTSINVFLDLTFGPLHELTLRGKISVDEGWPIPFETALTPRS